MPFVAVTGDPIRATDVLAHVGDDSHGAVLLFLGVVRDHHEGRAVTGISYEAYAAMAEAELGRIAEQAEARAGSQSIAVVHRVGELAVGEISVAVAVSSAHRAEAYEASRFIMEEIKKRVPVWKRERYADGTEEWVEGVLPVVEEGGRP
jgi:molybdopterin synthase catalytic subunit